MTCVRRSKPTELISVPLKLQLQAQQPCLTMKMDIFQDKTRMPVEGAASDARCGDVSSARIDDDLLSRTSFGDKELTKPSGVVMSSAHALVEAPKPRLSPVEMITPTPAGGSLHAGSASTKLFFFNLTYSRWASSLPSCLWSLKILPSFPGSRLTIFYRDASSAILQLVNQRLNFTYSRSHATVAKERAQILLWLESNSQLPH